jgi:tetratricopeptide (TPR) repeat protein
MDISKIKNKAPQIIAAIGVIAVVGAVAYYGLKATQGDRVARGGKYAELAKDHPRGAEFLDYINKAFDKLENQDASDDISAYIDIGFYENELGDKDGAIAAYKAGIKMSPKNELMLSNLAHLYEDKKDYASAEKYYKQIISANPKNARAITDLANLYRFYFKGRQQDIIDAVEIRGLAANPNDLNLLIFLANFYRYDEAAKNLQKAEINYRRILELDPKNLAVKVELNSLLRQQGRAPIPLNE